MARINFKTIAKNVDYTTFATYQEMLSYAGGSLSYPGQILGVLQAHDTPDNVTPFILDANKTPVGIASFTKVQEMIEDQIGNMAGALVLQGNVPSDEFNDALTNHTAGWTFVVTTAGTYVGQTCNIGDMIVCKTTGTSANNADWFVVESNQPNMVTSDISSPLNQEVPVFGATGKTIGGSGVSMGQVATILENQIQKGAGNLLTTEELNGIKQQLGVGGAASSAAKLTTARTIDGVAFDGSKAISHLGLCNTAANQAAKSATVTGFQLVEGARVNIFFPAGNTAQQPTLNINNTGAKNISFPPSMKSDIPAYGMMEFVYYSNSYMPISSGQLKTSIENAVVNDSGTPTVPNEIAIFRDTAGKDIMGAGFEADTLLALNGNKIGFGGGLELNDNELNGIKQQLGVGSEAAKLTTARTIDGMAFDGTKNITHFCVCSTAAGTAAKTVNLPGFVVAANQAYTGARISVKFTNGNTATSPTLSVNGSTAFPISWPGGALANIEANQVLDMVFQFGSTGGFNVIGSANNPNNVTNASGGATSDGEIPVFSDTTGKAIEGSGVNIGNLADKNFVDQKVNGLAPMYHILALQALQIPFSASNVKDAYLIRLNLPSVVTSSPNGIEALKSLIDTSNCVFYATLTPITNIDTLGDNYEVMIQIGSIFTSGRYLMFGGNRMTGKMTRAIAKTVPIIGLRCESNKPAVRLVGIDSIIGDGVIYYPNGDTVEFTER